METKPKLEDIKIPQVKEVIKIANKVIDDKNAKRENECIKEFQNLMIDILNTSRQGKFYLEKEFLHCGIYEIDKFSKLMNNAGYYTKTNFRFNYNKIGME